MYLLSNKSGKARYPPKPVISESCSCNRQNILPDHNEPAGIHAPLCDYSRLLYAFTMYADVIFPIKLTPLTYKIPQEAGYDLSGRIVTAPLMNKNRFGLAFNIRDELDAGMRGHDPARIKEIFSVHDRFASGTHIQFLQWLSEYYLTPMGVALKSSFFEEAAAAESAPGTTRRKKKADISCPDTAPGSNAALSPEMIEDVTESIKRNSYSALLYHAPDIDSELLASLEILRRISDGPGSIIALVPEVAFIRRLEPELRAIFGGRLSILHARLSKKDRTGTIKKILSGESDVVVGTRSAMLAPIPAARFIVVIEEQSASYKGEEGLRYNARDIAVMRAHIEKSCVALMSVCPSLESYYNAQRGKYRLLGKTPSGAEYGRPRVKIIRVNAKKQGGSSLSPEALSEAKNRLRKNESMLFLAGRKGYSLIRCRDCGHMDYCAKCEAPMIFYKSSGMLKCHHCGCERPAPDTCGECGGASLEPFAPGVERVREDIEQLLRDSATQAEKTAVSSPQTDKLGNGNHGLSDFMPFIIGAGGAKRKGCAKEKYSAAVLMNMDLLMARPDFRAQERAFQEIMGVSQLVKPEGSLLIQTRSRGSELLKYARDYDFESFYRMELAQRREITYPPYERIALLTISTRSENAIPDATWREVCGFCSETVTLFGPMDCPPRSASFTRCSQIILKSADNRKLHETAGKIMKKLGRDKKVLVTADVDPLKI
jgi:primosomal protein N' (replication factor Y) (superfamily II helicase)